MAPTKRVADRTQKKQLKEDDMLETRFDLPMDVNYEHAPGVQTETPQHDAIDEIDFTCDNEASDEESEGELSDLEPELSVNVESILLTDILTSAVRSKRRWGCLLIQLDQHSWDEVNPAELREWISENALKPKMKTIKKLHQAYAKAYSLEITYNQLIPDQSYKADDLVEITKDFDWGCLFRERLRSREIVSAGTLKRLTEELGIETCIVTEAAVKFESNRNEKALESEK